MEYLNRRKWKKIKSSKNDLISKILDMNNIKEKEKFLKMGMENMHSYLLLNDAKKAVESIKKAIHENKKIVIYTDYDTDGASGGAVAYLMLKERGADVSYYTNNRMSQGYGLCKSGIKDIKEIYPDVGLVITVDNGIVAHEGVDYCNEIGLDIIITDHHEPGDKLPDALAVINPKRKDSTYPFNGLCGAAVIWKLLQGLYVNLDESNKYLDIVAVATVGDVVPLIDENRVIVKEGLRLMNEESRLSLKILKEFTKTSLVKSDTLAFSYSPIFNAISRLKGDIDPVIDFLTSKDEKLIRKTVEILIEVNEERKEKTKEQVQIAENILEKKGIEKVIVVYDKGFDEGIVGLIAGKLKEKYNRPAFVLTDSDNKKDIKGSARSIPNYHIKNVLDDCEDLLKGYGGHELAGGLSLEKKNLEKLEKHLIKKSYELLTEDDYVKKYYYIEILKEEDINMDLIERIDQLEPYGEGFRKPLIRLKDFYVKRVFKMGKEKSHLKLIGDTLSLIAFGQSENYDKRGNPLKVSALGYPEINIYNNNVNIQFMVDGDNFM
jgi:single-stranded-DNA-specific exonuclease